MGRARGRGSRGRGRKGGRGSGRDGSSAKWGGTPSRLAALEAPTGTGLAVGIDGADPFSLADLHGDDMAEVIDGICIPEEDAVEVQPITDNGFDVDFGMHDSGDADPRPEPPEEDPPPPANDADRCIHGTSELGCLYDSRLGRVVGRVTQKFNSSVKITCSAHASKCGRLIAE